MTSATSLATVKHGLLAGAVGVTTLNLMTYLDMALRGRPASTMPEQLVETIADRTGRSIPGDRKTRGARRTALGALSGIGTGATVGILMSAVRSAGWRVSPGAEAAAGGLLAMAMSDLPAAMLGVTDPRRWSGTDWVSDVIPHLGYGLAAQQTLAALDGDEPQATEPVAIGTVLRSGLLGVASGCRSSLGFVGPRLASAPEDKRLPLAAVVGAEVVLDKLPKVPARTQPPGLVSRLASGGVGARQLARTAGQDASIPVLAGAAGSAIGAFGGLAWRDWAGQRMPKWCAAVAEDVAAVSATYVACRPPAKTG
jgi:uncharacterized membrane protein